MSMQRVGPVFEYLHIRWMREESDAQHQFWAYKLPSAPEADPPVTFENHDTQEHLNKLGADGWQLTGATPFSLFFQRVAIAQMTPQERFLSEAIDDGDDLGDLPDTALIRP